MSVQQIPFDVPKELLVPKLALTVMCVIAPLNPAAAASLPLTVVNPSKSPHRGIPTSRSTTDKPGERRTKRSEPPDQRCTNHMTTWRHVAAHSATHPTFRHAGSLCVQLLVDASKSLHFCANNHPRMDVLGLCQTYLIGATTVCDRQ